MNAGEIDDQGRVIDDAGIARSRGSFWILKKQLRKAEAYGWVVDPVYRDIALVVVRKE